MRFAADEWLWGVLLSLLLAIILIVQGIRLGRARKAFLLALASAALLLLPGAWLVSLAGAPLALVNAVLVLRETRGSARQGRTRARAWLGAAIAALVLAAVALHLWRAARAGGDLLRGLAG